MSGIRDFAKIVAASDGRQVLFYIDPNGGDYVLHQIANYDGLQADMRLEFASEDKDENERRVRAAFDAMNQEAADRCVAIVMGFFQGEDA